ncbi:MAG: AMP-binding protein, partial [Caldimonas sp.]
MPESNLLFELLAHAAERTPSAIALTHGAASLSYGALQAEVEGFAAGVLALGLQRGERVGIYLEKRFETVVASFGAPAAGAVFVPLNPLLKPEQVGHILRDCNVRVLVTSPERLALLAEELGRCPDLRSVVLAGSSKDVTPAKAAAQGRLSMHALHPGFRRDDSGGGGGSGGIGSRALSITSWQDLLDAARRPGHRVIDVDMAAILYTSGSTGKPKGVVLSHRNIVAGAKSVASYLENVAGDTLLAALPLSFDAGFSQLTTAFHAGARVVLLNYLLPRDVLKALDRERVTGLTAVPPLYIQLAQLEWPQSVQNTLRYFANTGGRMPRETLALLRRR